MEYVDNEKVDDKDYNSKKRRFTILKITLVILLIVAVSVLLYFIFFNVDLKSEIVYLSIVNNKGEILKENTFSNDDIKEVIIEDGITSIESNAFYKCKKLEKIEVLADISSIDDNAITKCNDDILFKVYENSKAEEYAKNKGYKIEYIENQENILPTYLRNEVLNSSKKAKDISSDIKFTYITDIHADRLKYSGLANVNAFNMVQNLKITDFGIFGGDMITDDDNNDRENMINNISFYAKLLNNNISNTFFTIGNHDTKLKIKNSDGSKEIIPLDFDVYYNNALKNSRENLIFNDKDNKTSYYYDIKDKKIRVCFLGGVDDDSSMCFNDKELDFLSNNVLNFHNKKDFNEWQVLIFTHAFEKTKYHDSVKNFEKVYSILNAFQNGEEKDIDENLHVNFKVQGKGTLIAVITGHHHADTTVIKNGILTISVRTAAINADKVEDSDEKRNKDDISFGIFSIDTKNKIIYETKVGRGNDRKWSYDISDIKEIVVQDVDTDTNLYNLSANNLFEWGISKDINGKYVMIVNSKNDFVEDKSSYWKLSKDKKTYIKVVRGVNSITIEKFSDINGNEKIINFGDYIK